MCKTLSHTRQCCTGESDQRPLENTYSINEWHDTNAWSKFNYIKSLRSLYVSTNAFVAYPSSCPRLRHDYYIYTVSVSTSKKGWRPIIYIVLSLNYIYIYRSRFFHVEASRLFIEPRAHDCYLSIDDKRNPIREARLTRIEKVGKKDWKINVTLFKKKKSILFSSSVTINPFVDTCNESEESIVPEIFSVSRSVRSFEYMYTCRVIRDSCVGIRRENV